MKKNVLEPPKNIALEFKSGNTNIRISDDYCMDKTAEDVEAILDGIARNALRHYAMARRVENEPTTAV